MSSFTGSGAVEKDPVIYIRFTQDKSYSWAALKTDVDLSNQPNICECGAKASLESCFRRNKRPPSNSSIAAVGSKIYTFGGVDLDIGFRARTREVSCIDTLCPDKGWKILKEMPSSLRRAYTVTIDENRVFLVGGMDMRSHDSTAQAHMYYVNTDTCVPLYNDFDLPNMTGHGVVDIEGKKFGVMHSCYSCGLFCYDVEKDCWKHDWQTVFDDSCSASALIDGIYYVLDNSRYARNLNLHFSGYDVTLEDPNRLPVEIELDKRNNDVQWVPPKDADGFVVTVRLLSLGNSKLAMLWYYTCQEKSPSDSRSSVLCSIFKMTKMKDDSGGLKLVALPLSNTCHHFEGWTFRDCVLVYDVCISRVTLAIIWNICRAKLNASCYGADGEFEQSFVH